MRINKNRLIHYKPEQLKNIKEIVKVSFTSRTPQIKTYNVVFESETDLACEGLWSFLNKTSLGSINRSTIYILPEDVSKIERLYHEFELKRHLKDLEKLRARIEKHRKALSKCSV